MFCLGGFWQGGFCPRGFCPGVYVRGVFVQGVFVLEPSFSVDPIDYQSEIEAIYIEVSVIKYTGETSR